MDDNKKWYESKGVWGGIVAVAAAGASAFGYALDASLQASIVDLIVAGAGLVGGALAVWGRISASKVITAQ